jgi:hypothetical protein
MQAASSSAVDNGSGRRRVQTHFVPVTCLGGDGDEGCAGSAVLVPREGGERRPLGGRYGDDRAALILRVTDVDGGGGLGDLYTVATGPL